MIEFKDELNSKSPSCHRSSQCHNGRFERIILKLRQSGMIVTKMDLESGGHGYDGRPSVVQVGVDCSYLCFITQ